MAKSNGVFECRDLDANELAEVSKLYNGSQVESMRVGPKGYYLSKGYKELASDIYNMPLRADDIFVTTFQRSGTTWVQEIVWLLVNDLNYEMAAAEMLSERSPTLEMSLYFNDDAANESVLEMSANPEKSRKIIDSRSTPGIKFLTELPSPRIVKSHLPISLLPLKLLDTAKVVYVARDPRDVIVSNFHLGKFFNLNGFKYTGDFKQMWTALRKDLFMLTPYFEHVKEAWAIRNHPNMIFLFYEDLSKDLPGSIRRVAKFLGKELTQEQMARLCDHVSIHNFKNNKSVNFENLRDTGLINKSETFIRKGKTGGWRDYFDAEMTAQADRWIADNLRDTDLRFPSMENK